MHWKRFPRSHAPMQGQEGHAEEIILFPSAVAMRCVGCWADYSLALVVGLLLVQLDVAPSPGVFFFSFFFFFSSLPRVAGL